jgi:dTDP-4-dehydrorhamnose 3,5-epimerase
MALRDGIIPGLLLTELRRIPTPNGEVRHAMRACDLGFAGFGEAYFSEVLFGAVKGWKRHRVMTMNLVVVSGTVCFIVHDGAGSCTRQMLSSEGVAPYGRLTVPPGVWMAFAGIGVGANLILNLASHAHDPAEAETCDLEVFAPLLDRLHA